MSAADSRTYVVGLPVIVTVHPEGFVSVEVDTAELGVAIRGDEETEHSAEQAAEDADTADAWATTHMVRAEGFAR